MANLIGGPYHGENLPVEPNEVHTMRLPSPEYVDEFLFDPLATGELHWTVQYTADLSVQPPVYRFCDPEGGAEAMVLDAIIMDTTDTVEEAPT